MSMRVIAVLLFVASAVCLWLAALQATTYAQMGWLGLALAVTGLVFFAWGDNPPVVVRKGP